MTVDVKIENDLISLSGHLTQQTITSTLEKQAKQFIDGQTLVVDLAAVDKVDTAGLAWLLTLVELANGRQCQIHFKNLSQELRNLSKLTAVDSFLPVQ